MVLRESMHHSNPRIEKRGFVIWFPSILRKKLSEKKTTRVGKQRLVRFVLKVHSVSQSPLL